MHERGSTIRLLHSVDSSIRELSSPTTIVVEVIRFSFGMLVSALCKLAGVTATDDDRAIVSRWARFVAEDSSAVGTLVRRALEAYRDRRW